MQRENISFVFDQNNGLMCHVKGYFNVLSPTAPDSSSVWIRGTVTDVAAIAGDDFDHTVNVNIVAAPVPEPESWAMLLAGLGIIGATVRRRRATRRTA